METTIEDPVGDLSCKIFLEAGASQPELVALLSEGTNPQVTHGPASALIKNEVGELELRRNDDRDEVSARRYPDGFLHFRYVIEYYPRPAVKHEDEVGYVARLLDRLWSRGWPAVAACDHENELPHQGGYGDDSLPWPSRALNGLADPSRCAQELESRSPG